MKRLHSIDFLRTIAIVLMIEIHLVDYLSHKAERDTLLYAILETLGSIPAPLFTFLAGVSLFISLSKYTAKIARRQTLRRGVAIFIIGLLHYFIHWGAEYVFSWDILTLIGSALLILYLLRRVRWVDIALIITAVILISPILRELTNYNQHWDFATGEYTYLLTFKDIFLGWLLHGFFPIFPWIIFPLAGYASGRAILNMQDEEKQRKRAWMVGLLGVLLAFFSAIGVWAQNIFGSNAYTSPLLFYPASTTYILLTLGISLFSFAGLWILLDAEEMSTARPKWTQGRFALAVIHLRFICCIIQSIFIPSI